MNKVCPCFLYVEDDAMSRNVIKVLLTKIMGFDQLTIFNNSANFMEHISTLSPAPDVIMLDIQIRPYDGYQVLEMLRNDPDYQDATIIALTANVMAHDVEQLKTVGFDGLIGKPIMKEFFPQFIHQILNGEPVWYVP